MQWYFQRYVARFGGAGAPERVECLLVIGAAEVITSPAQSRRTEQLHLAPWGSLRDRGFIRLPADEITGRRISLNPGTITLIRESSQNRDPEFGPE